MAITFSKTAVSGSFPVFWRGECKVLPGDFKLKQTFAEGDIIKKGTPIQLDFENMEAGVVKVAKVVSGGTTTKPRVVKGTLLKAGDVVMKLGKDDASPTVSSIDTSSADYDVITLSAAITGLAAGDFLQESSAYVAAVTEPAADAVPAAPLYVADAVVETTKEYSLNGFQTVSAGYDVVILKEVAYPIPSDWLEGFSLKGNHSIKYINQ